MPPRAKKISEDETDIGKRYLVTLRLGRKTREKLEKAANESGRSLTAEAEARLEWTFRLNEQAELDVLQLKFGPFLGTLLLAGLTANSVGEMQQTLSFGRQDGLWKKWEEEDARRRKKGERFTLSRAEYILPLLQSHWVDDPVSYRKAITAATYVLKELQPPENGEEDLFPALDGAEVAEMLLKSVSPRNRDLRLIRSLLGDLIERLNRKPDAESKSHSEPPVHS